MSKQEFLEQLRLRLVGLPANEIEGHLAFYGEAIDDRIEDGLSEEDAVLDIGTVDGIAEHIVSDISFTKIAKGRIESKRRLCTWEIILLVLGSPIWLSLVIVAFAVLFSLYVVLWSLIASAWAIFASLAACAVGGVTSGIIFAVTGNCLSGIATIGASIALAGLAILAFFGCKATTKGFVLLTKKLARNIKKLFIGKEEAK